MRGALVVPSHDGDGDGNTGGGCQARAGVGQPATLCRRAAPMVQRHGTCDQVEAHIGGPYRIRSYRWQRGLGGFRA
ncbi:Uncharacterised protein [Mycobacteroides abscessus subsp. abscessus]|nr:Uncharacterised protein [Mycobacteroides abscessus subsp. abscessus]